MSAALNNTKAKARAAAEIAKQEEAKIRAARQAATVLTDPAAPELVQCRILPMGDGKVSMGVHAGGIGEAHYERGETPTFEKSVAIALQERGFVEITG